MIMLVAIFLQAAQQPDIELNANVRAKSVTIEKQGNAQLSISTSPEGENVVDVQAPKANGQKTLRNVQVEVRAHGRIADPGQTPPNNPDQPETARQE
jgi:hypothetical protein